MSPIVAAHNMSFIQREVCGHGSSFQEWRDARDWTKRKYAVWARGELLPSQKPNSMMGCPRGERFNSHDPACNQIHRRISIRRRRLMGYDANARCVAAPTLVAGTYFHLNLTFAEVTYPRVSVWAGVKKCILMRSGSPFSQQERQI